MEDTCTYRVFNATTQSYEVCGAAAKLVLDPYNFEIDEQEIWRVLCKEHLQARWDDI